MKGHVQNMLAMENMHNTVCSQPHVHVHVHVDMLMDYDTLTCS